MTDSRHTGSQALAVVSVAVAAAPFKSGAWACLTLIRAALPTALMIQLGQLIDALPGAREEIIWSLILFVLLFIALQVSGPLTSLVALDLGMTVADKTQNRLAHATIAQLDLRHIEDPDNHEDAAAADEMVGGPSGPPLFVGIRVFGEGASTVLSGIIAAIALASYAWWVGAVLVVSWTMIGALLKNAVSATGWNEPEVKNALRESEQQYGFATSPSFAKEVRVFRAQDWVSGRLRATHQVLLAYDRGTVRVWRLWTSAAIIIGANAVAILFVFNGASSGALAIGAVVSFSGLLATVSDVATLDFYWSLDILSRPLPAARRLLHKLATKEPMQDGSSPVGSGPFDIEFQNVWFSYGDKDVLKGVSFRIPAGTTAALVGLNGAGKSTIIKLLCRFYDPDIGTVAIDGRDLRTLTLASWRKSLVVAFQRLTTYPWSIGENIVPLAEDPSAAAPFVAEAALSDLGDLTQMTGGDFGGVELSGGQWQKVGIARALAKLDAGGSTLILDEPTSQMDVEAEKGTFERLLQARPGKSVLLVSHRLATVSRADEILVLSEGRVSEQGSHKSLMKLNGEYARLYRLQADAYSSEEEAS